MAKNGLYLITPTSIAYTGTSASISANGSVSFSAISSLTLNGVFTSDYDNYMIVWRGTSASAGDIEMRLSAGGSADSGSNYAWQFLSANGTTVSGTRYTSFLYGRLGQAEGLQTMGYVAYVYGPALLQPTAYRSVTAIDASSARILDHAGTHNQSLSYDGINFWDGTHTGRVAVYGMRK